FDRRDVQAKVAAPAVNSQRQRATDDARIHEALEVVHAVHRDAVDLQDQVLGLQAGLRRWTGLDHLDDLHACRAARPFGQARRKRPRAASAPPEFPGWSAASVWITLSTSLDTEPDRAGSERPRALMMPALTDPAKPSGLPMATTSCPTRSRDASPSSAGVMGPPPVARTT